MLTSQSCRNAAAALLGVALAVFGLTARAEIEPQNASFTLMEENDAFAGPDRHYTQGIKLSYFHAEGHLPFGLSKVVDWLPEWGFRESVGRVGYDVGQMFYTPGDKLTATVVTNDRPYAGWLYAGLILQRRGIGWWEKPMLESLELELGVVGPWSLAQETQDFGHKILKFGNAQGWANQLPNEPGLLLKYSRWLRLPVARAAFFESDFIPHGGVSLGNINTSLRLGGMWRVGVRLPDDFGTQNIESLQTAAGSYPRNGRPGWGGYVFAGAEGRAVAYNEFLDGSVFHTSHSVAKEAFVGDFQCGAVLVLHHVEIGYLHTFRSKEFVKQTTDDSFGSIYFRVRF
ncbi:MAG TPA: lipid A deacylase LpxR family protein [Verrucomicrobiae bacterium]